MSWKFSSTHPGIYGSFIYLLLYEPCRKPDAESTPKGNKTDDDNNVDSSDDETDDGETPGDSHLSPSGGGKLTPYSASSASPVKERHSSPRSSRGRSVSPMKHIYNGASESDAATSQRSGRSSESPEKKCKLRSWGMWVKSGRKTVFLIFQPTHCIFIMISVKKCGEKNSNGKS